MTLLGQGFVACLPGRIGLFLVHWMRLSSVVVLRRLVLGLILAISFDNIITLPGTIDKDNGVDWISESANHITAFLQAIFCEVMKWIQQT